MRLIRVFRRGGIRLVFDRVSSKIIEKIVEIKLRRIDFRSNTFKLTRLEERTIQLNLSEDDIVLLKSNADRYSQGCFRYFSCKDVNLSDIDEKSILDSLPSKFVDSTVYFFGLRGDKFVGLNWHRDWSSNFIWPIDVSGKRCLGMSLSTAGVDIKYPWELGRLYFLLEYSLSYNITKETEYREKFAFTIYDFLAKNPIGFGVQWACTMDVSIRLVNVLIGYNILGDFSDNRLEKAIAVLIEGSALYIRNNLERDTHFVNNHFFSNVCGLVFYYGNSELNDYNLNRLRHWVSEFCGQVLFQFNRDGSNFEASTAYHLLVYEMVIYTTSFILGLNHIYCKSFREGLVDSGYFVEVNGVLTLTSLITERICRIHDFARSIFFESGEILQVGDNDSGRFVMPIQRFLSVHNHECTQDMSGIIAAGESLLGLNVSDSAESMVVQFLSGKSSLDYIPRPAKVEKDSMQMNFRLKDLTFKHLATFNVELDEDYSVNYYPDFGMIIWKGLGFFMSLYFGGVGQCGNGGHSHNDKLTVSLLSNGEMILTDPGSNCYTSFPKRRNLYRSYCVHPFAVDITSQKDDEEFKFGLFSFPYSFETRVLDYSKSGCRVFLKVNEREYLREISISRNNISIKTFSNKPFVLGDNLDLPKNGYGRQE